MNIYNAHRRSPISRLSYPVFRVSYVSPVSSCRMSYVMSYHVMSRHPIGRGGSNLRTVEKNHQNRRETIITRVRIPLHSFSSVSKTSRKYSKYDIPRPKIFRKFLDVGYKTPKSCQNRPASSHDNPFKSNFPSSKIYRKC